MIIAPRLHLETPRLLLVEEEVVAVDNPLVEAQAAASNNATKCSSPRRTMLRFMPPRSFRT
jgi:hypothetical protein